MGRAREKLRCPEWSEEEDEDKDTDHKAVYRVGEGLGVITPECSYSVKGRIDREGGEGK